MRLVPTGAILFPEHQTCMHWTARKDLWKKCFLQNRGKGSHLWKKIKSLIAALWKKRKGKEYKALMRMTHSHSVPLTHSFCPSRKAPKRWYNHRNQGKWRFCGVHSSNNVSFYWRDTVFIPLLGREYSFQETQVIFAFPEYDCSENSAKPCKALLNLIQRTTRKTH